MLMNRPATPGGHHNLGGAPGTIGHAAVVGAVFGYFAVVALIASILLVAGSGFVVALGVGAFVGIWGGPGWGGMIAAQIRADRLEEEERRAGR
ncbi:MAG TPA: hypothetical protein VFS16_20730 [Acidimicrobiia bacterium]|nr:hypothetical protein [Acidimicrobiia bacterium]